MASWALLVLHVLWTCILTTPAVRSGRLAASYPPLLELGSIDNRAFTMASAYVESRGLDKNNSRDKVGHDANTLTLFVRPHTGFAGQLSKAAASIGWETCTAELLMLWNSGTMASSSLPVAAV